MQWQGQLGVSRLEMPRLPNAKNVRNTTGNALNTPVDPYIVVLLCLDLNQNGEKSIGTC